MEKWKTIQRAYIIGEIIVIISIIILIILGMLCDFYVLIKDTSIIIIDDIESFSLTILQIQATVGTLIFTIIALIAGNISDSYMGISVSDFYLNKKPWKLTQKILIIISLVLCLLSIISYCFSLFNTVFYLFIATFIVILLSILQLYSAFIGRNKLHQEIESYVNYMLEKNVKIEKKINNFQFFVLDWIKIVDSQDKQSYNDFFNIFKKYVDTLLEDKSDETLLSIEQQCYDMSYCLLGSEKTKSKANGLEFIQEIYNKLWEFVFKSINDNNFQTFKYKYNFTFFSEICSELMQSIEEMSIRDVEKKLDFNYLVDSILRIAVWFDCTKKDDIKDDMNKRKYDNYDNEINELMAFAKYLGYYLEKTKNKNNIVNQSIWENVLSKRLIFSTYNIPKTRKDEFLKAKYYIYFSYCYGMIINGQEDIIKKGLYLKGMKTCVILDNEYQALLYLSVHCYIYYLAIRENNTCVSETIRQSALFLWNDNKVKASFYEFLILLAENPTWLNFDTFDQMSKILDKFELFPQYGFSKYLIMEYVATDFYLFIILFISNQFHVPELLENNIDDMQFFKYISNKNNIKTKEMLSELFNMISIDIKSQKEVNRKVDLMYDNLEKLVKKKQKERYMKLAEEAQQNFEAKINIENISNKIKYDIIKNIKEKFSSILVNTDEKKTILEIPLLTIDDYTSSIESKYNTNMYFSDINGIFLSYIIDFLYKERVVELKNRLNDFKNDKEFMDYLAVNDLHLLLGSKYILNNKDYLIKDEYQMFLEDYETIYTTIVRKGIALKKGSIQVCLHDINVSIRSPSIEEEKVNYDSVTKKYHYPILDNLPIDFDEEELRKFLYNNRKIITITAEISIQINEKMCGTIFIER